MTFDSATSACTVATAPTVNQCSSVKEVQSLWSQSSSESESTSAASSEIHSDCSSDVGSCEDVSCDVHDEKEVRTKVQPAPATFFASSSEPSIAIEDFLLRIWKFSKCSESCRVLALIYVDRLVEMNPSIAVDARSIHRLFAIATIVSTKVQDDDLCSNEYYAKICGLRLGELNLSEARFLSLIGWKLYVSSEEYDCRLCQVESLCASWGLSEAAVISQLALH